jgi:hypothetical protein
MHGAQLLLQGAWASIPKKHLLKRAEIARQEGRDKAATKILAIIQREHDKSFWRKINYTCGKGKGGSPTSVQVPRNGSKDHVGTLKDGYIRNVPLPRVPRLQSASLVTHGPSRCKMAVHTPSRCTMAGNASAITYYSHVPRVPSWRDLTRSLLGFGRRTPLPFFPVRLM